MDENITILMNQLDIDETKATVLLEKHEGDIIEAITHYIEPNKEYQVTEKYNTTYNNLTNDIIKINELRTIVNDKENVLQKNK